MRVTHSFWLLMRPAAKRNWGEVSRLFLRICANTSGHIHSSRLKDVELAAERVLSDKHEVVALDRRRNAAREAARALEAAAAKDWRGDGGKAWVAMGGANCFIKMPVAGAKEMLRKGNT